MGMQVSMNDDGDDHVVSEINTTPLVDVMLVLLIIFLITIPVVTTSIKVDLPKEKNQIRETKPENIIISVNKQGQMFWYDTPVKTTNELVDRLKSTMKKYPIDNQPEVQIRGDGAADYASAGKIVYAAQRAGIAKVGFITEPPPNQ